MSECEDAIFVRRYGESGPWVVVLHGGPAGVGNAAPIARGLADDFRVLEPWQRGSGTGPLTVGRHVADLHEIILTRCNGARPALVGESWGAMLALAYAAEHPDTAGPLVLIGCGTFDPAARARMRATIQERLGEDGRARMARMETDFPDPEERLREQYRLMHPVFDYDAVAAEPGDAGPFDMRAHTETWDDMVRLQEAGAYPAAFASIVSPVIMLHGTYDPHPGPMVRDSLLPYLPQLEYREWERCGHSPWLERAVREEFLAVLGDWLKRRLAEP